MIRKGLVFVLLLSLGTAFAANFGTQIKPGGKPYDAVVREIAGKHGVDPELIHAVIKAESNYDRFAVSPKGAMGLMQLMPDTAKAYGVANVADPKQNIEGGTRYIKDLMKLFNSSTQYVLAAYNAGQEAVKKYNGIPPYAETRAYIRRIQSTYKPSTISRGRTQIFRCLDESGRVLFTNDPNNPHIVRNREKR